MLPKNFRASAKEVEKIFKEGRFLNSSHLSFKYIKIGGRDCHVSFVAPKSIAKLATKRSLLRRRGYAALGKHIDNLPIGIAGAFIFKKYQDDVLILSHEIKEILSKIN